MFIVHTTEEIQGLIDAHEQFKSTLGEADREFQGIMSLSNEASHLATQYGLMNENPYTTLQVGTTPCWRRSWSESVVFILLAPCLVSGRDD